MIEIVALLLSGIAILGVGILWIRISLAQDSLESRLRVRTDELETWTRNNATTSKEMFDHLMNKERGEDLVWRLNDISKRLKLDLEYGYLYPSSVEERMPGINPYISKFPQLTLAEAENKLNKLLVAEHEKCIDLDEAEEKLVMDRRKKNFDKYWIEVTPRKQGVKK